MITVVEGRPGMGKSVWLVSEILRYLRNGHNVYTNVAISDVRLKRRFGDRLHFIESLEDCIHLRHGKIVLDEIQTYLNSRNWDKLDVRFQLLLQQHRKKGLDILGATQSIKRADVVFRELVQVFYRIKKLLVFKIPFVKASIGFFYLREYDPDDMEAGGKKSNQEAVGWFIPFVADPFTFSVYDTTQEYEPTVRVGKRFVQEYVIAKKEVEFQQITATREVPTPSEVVPSSTEVEISHADVKDALIPPAGDHRFLKVIHQ